MNIIKIIKSFLSAITVIILTFSLLAYISAMFVFLAAPFLPNYHWYLSLICFFMWVIPITYIIYKHENNR